MQKSEINIERYSLHEKNKIIQSTDDKFFMQEYKSWKNKIVQISKLFKQHKNDKSIKEATKPHPGRPQKIANSHDQAMIP